MCKILIAEDDQDLREVYSLILKKDGFTTIEAIDGEDAIKKFDALNEKPEVIIIDYRMPKRNGLEVISEIQRREPKSNIVMITGEARLEEMIDANCGIVFKTKPIRMNEFLSEIRNFAQI